MRRTAAATIAMPRRGDKKNLSSSSSSPPPSPSPSPSSHTKRRRPSPSLGAGEPADMSSDAERQLAVGAFLEIAAGQSPEVATQFLEATGWSLESALQLFYAAPPPPTAPAPLPEQAEAAASVVGAEAENVVAPDAEEGGVRAPMPVIRDTLYGRPEVVALQPNTVVAFRNFEEEARRPAVWDSEQNAASTANGSLDSLASLYRPPFALMYTGSFEKAKMEASYENKWLLINLQSTEEFSSHMLNRDTWANDTLAQTISSNFIFWQVYHDTSEGKKVCNYYNLFSMPAILVIDPITGQKMRAWNGMVQADRLLEDLLPFLDKSPKDHHSNQPQKRPRKVNPELTAPLKDNVSTEVDDDEAVALAIAKSLEERKAATAEHSANEKAEPEKEAPSNSVGIPEYPPLPEEPKVSRDLLCRVGIRLPDGRRIQRSFLRTDPVKYLWSFCSSQVEDGEKQPFHFAQAIPGAQKSLTYDSNETFEEAGLSNSMVNFLWDSAPPGRI